MRKLLCLFLLSVISSAVSASDNVIWLRLRIDGLKSNVKMRAMVYWEPHFRRAAFNIPTAGIPITFAPKRLPWNKIPATGTLKVSKWSDWINLTELLASDKVTLKNKNDKWNFNNAFLLSLAAHNKDFMPERKLYPGNWYDAGNVSNYKLTLELSNEVDKKAKRTICINVKHPVTTLYFPSSMEVAADKRIACINTLSGLLQRYYKAELAVGANQFIPAKQFYSVVPVSVSPHLPLYSEADRQKIEEISRLLGANQLYVNGFHPVQDLLFRKLDIWDNSSLIKLVKLKHLKVPMGKTCFIKMGDEPFLIPISVLTKSKKGMEKFAEYLQKQNVTPTALGIASWETLTPIKRTEVKTKEQALLYYHTIWFLQDSIAKICAETKRLLQEKYGKNILLFTDANRSRKGSFRKYPDYFIESRYGAFDRQGHHYGSGDDWGPRDYAANIFLADIFRSASEQGNIKPGLLWFTCRIAQKDGVLQSGATALARGINFFYHYGAKPIYMGGEWLIDDHWKCKTFSAANTIMQLAAKYDSYLNSTLRPKSKVAIVLDRSGDIWRHFNSTKPDGVDFERRMMHFILSVSGYYVDIIPEESVEQGKLKNYTAVYVISPNLTEKAGSAIEHFVRNGGTLYLGYKAATRNKINEKYDLLQKKFNRSIKTTDYSLHGSLPLYYGVRNLQRIINKVTLDWGNKKYQIPGYTEALTLKEAKVLAKYADGNAALISFGYGKGMVFKSGTGLAGIITRTAIPGYTVVRRSPKIPRTHGDGGHLGFARHTMDTNLLSLLLLPLRKGTRLVPSVKLSQFGIDTGFFEKPDGTGALLILSRYNRGESHLAVELPNCFKYTKATAFSGEPVKLSNNGKKIEINLNIIDAIELLP